MGVALYLLRKNFKNWINELKKKPVQLLLILLGVCSLLGVLVMMIFIPTPEVSVVSAENTTSIFFAAATVVFIFIALNSSSGMFSKADTQFLFTSPLTNKKVLVIGTLKSLFKIVNVALIMAVYPIFFKSLLKFESVDLIAFYICIVFISIIAMMLSLIVFISTINSKKKKSLFNRIIALPFILASVYVITQSLGSGNASEVIYNFISSGVVLGFPIVGWQFGIYYFILIGNYGMAALCIAGSLALFALLCFIFSKINNEYYEQATALASIHSKKREAKAAGDITGQLFANKKVKIKSTGLKGGNGASVLFYKQRLEMKRSGLYFFDFGVILTLIVAFASMITSDLSGTSIIYSSLAFGCYISIFLIFTSSLEKEINNTFICTLPDGPFKKLLYATSLTILKVVLQAIFMFTLIGVLAKAPVIDVILCILVYIGFQFITIAGSILFYRIFKRQISNKNPLKALMFLFITILAIPGIAVSVVLIILTQQRAWIAVDVLINAIIALGVIYICKNLLESIEN